MVKHKHKKVTHHHHKAKTKLPKSLLWLIGGVVLFFLVSIFANYSISDQKMDKPQITPQAAEELTPDERKLIDQWIKNTNLNRYGDPKGTVYTGGTPLFNEATGQYKDLYQYILERHPYRPWNK
jgi:hypothetical protein